jgi:hypothetical protein
MRNNLNQLINKQLVDQFQNVVKAEIRKHNTAIEKTDHAIEELKKTFSEFYEENKNTKSTTESLYRDILKNFKDCTDEISDSFNDQRIFIKENDKKLNRIIEEFEQTIKSLVNFQCFEDYRIDTLHDFSSLQKEFEESKELIRVEIWDSYKKNRSYIHSTSKESNERSDEIKGLLVSLKKDLEEYKTDAVGILRENEVVKKSMFIMEKKIENIYTLIARLTKKE